MKHPHLPPHAPDDEEEELRRPPVEPDEGQLPASGIPEDPEFEKVVPRPT